MKATGRNSIGWRHFEHCVIEKALQCRGDDSRATRSSAGIGRFIVLDDERGSHAAEWSFTWFDDIGFALNQPKGVGLTGIGGEIIQFIV